MELDVEKPHVRLIEGVGSNTQINSINMEDSQKYKNSENEKNQTGSTGSQTNLH